MERQALKSMSAASADVLRKGKNVFFLLGTDGGDHKNSRGLSCISVRSSSSFPPLPPELRVVIQSVFLNTFCVFPG